MRFLFVGPRLCLRLPSDSASRRTPLPSGYRFPPSGSEEDLHLQVTKQPPWLIGWRLRATRHAWRTYKKSLQETPQALKLKLISVLVFFWCLRSFWSSSSSCGGCNSTLSRHGSLNRLRCLNSRCRCRCFFFFLATSSESSGKGQYECQCNQLFHCVSFFTFVIDHLNATRMVLKSISEYTH